MKLLKLTFALLFTLSFFTKSQEPIPVIEPCISDFIIDEGLSCDIPWDGPKYDTVCMNQLPPQEPLCSPPYDCCFIIQYYDRIIQCPNDTNARYYDLQVTQLSYLGQCSDCYQIVKDRIEIYIINKKNQEHSEYFEWKWGNLDPGEKTCIDQHHYTSKGHCYNGQDTTNECTNERCCVKKVQICYDAEGQIIPSDTKIIEESLFGDMELDSIEGSGVTCLQLGCSDGIPKCGKYSHHFIDDPCDTLIDCNNEPWIRDSIASYSMELFGCPICSLKVYYQRRNFTCGGRYYHDIRLTKIEKLWEGSYCDSCLQVNLGDTTIPYAAIYWHMVKKVVDTVASSYLVNGQCDTNFRIFNFACWNVSPYTGDYEPCAANGCCVGRYSVCKINNTIITEKLESITTGSTPCNLASVPCDYVCDDESLPKVSFQGEPNIQNSACIFNSKVVPNPNDGDFEFHIASSVEGKLDIVIYDLLGRIILKIENQKINSFVKIPVSIQYSNNSVLYYSITLNDRYKDYQLINIQP